MFVASGSCRALRTRAMASWPRRVFVVSRVPSSACPNGWPCRRTNGVRAEAQRHIRAEGADKGTRSRARPPRRSTTGRPVARPTRSRQATATAEKRCTRVRWSHGRSPAAVAPLALEASARAAWMATGDHGSHPSCASAARRSARVVASLPGTSLTPDTPSSLTSSTIVRRAYGVWRRASGRVADGNGRHVDRRCTRALLRTEHGVG